MSVKFTDIVSKGDMAKIIILIVISSMLWIWVWTESKKPILPEGLADDYFHVEEIE